MSLSVQQVLFTTETYMIGNEISENILFLHKTRDFLEKVG